MPPLSSSADHNIIILHTHNTHTYRLSSSFIRSDKGCKERDKTSCYYLFLFLLSVSDRVIITWWDSTRLFNPRHTHKCQDQNQTLRLDPRHSRLLSKWETKKEDTGKPYPVLLRFSANCKDNICTLTQASYVSDQLFFLCTIIKDKSKLYWPTNKDGILSVFQGYICFKFSSFKGWSRIICINTNHRSTPSIQGLLRNSPASHCPNHPQPRYPVLTHIHSRQNIPHTCIVLIFYFLVMTSFYILSTNNGLRSEESRDK